MPTFLQRFLEWYLDLPPTPPGQGTAWRLEFGAPPGSMGALPLLGWAAAAAVVIVVLVYRRDAAGLSWGRRCGLVALRLASVGVVLLMLSRLSLRVDRTELPTVAVLIDVSGSMGLSDRYQDRRLAAAAARLASGPRESPGDGPTRLQLVQAIVTRERGQWLRQLQQTHQVRLYAFDEHLRPLRTAAEDRAAEGSEAESPERALLAAVLQLTSEGGLTAPASAVRAVLEEHRGRPLGGVVLFTDGAATVGEEERLSVAASLARERGVPLFPIGIGSDDPARDIELYDLLSDDVVYVGDPVTLSVRLRNFGYAGQTTELRVAAEGDDRVLASRRVQLPAEGTARVEELTFVPQQEGEYRLTITAVPLPGELDTQNNTLRQQITVRRDQFRVLLVEGPPRWEYRALKPVLERDDAILVETYLQEADLNFAPEDRTALESFPATRAQLERYDAIIWGDVDLGGLDRGAAERLREFVRDHGGGVIFIAGERHNPWGYAGSPLEVLLPFRLEGVEPVLIESGASPGRFRLERTVEGRAWPWMRLADEAAEDEAAWRSLPAEMDWFVRIEDLKPGALALAVRAASGGEPVPDPLILHQRYGRGQVLYHAVDSLWTWRRRVEDRYYGRYWSQAVRAVAAGRIRRVESGWELTTDRRTYRPGEAVHLRLRGSPAELPEGIGPSTPVQVRIESPGGEQTLVPLTPRPGESHVWEGTATRLPLGVHTATLATDDPAVPGPSCTFLVELPNRELRDRKIARTDLELAAKISQGSFVMFADADAVPASIPRRPAVRLTQSRPIPLWNRGELLTLLILLLAGEWVLRKRSRLV